MRKIPLVLYYVFIMTAGVIAGLYSYKTLGFSIDSNSLAFFLFLTVLAIITECYSIKMPKYGLIPAADTFYYVLMITLGPLVAGIASATANCAKAVYEMGIKKQGVDLHVFNIFQVPLIFIISGLMFSYFYNSDTFFDGTKTTIINILLIIVISLFSIVLRNMLTTIHYILESKMPVSYLWQLDFSRIKIYLGTIPAIAVLIATTYQEVPWALFLLAMPLALVYVSIKRYSDLLNEVKSTMETLAEIIEARDPHMVDHAERVARYSMEIGKKLNLSREMLEHLESAARMHDLGKVSIADDILGKLDSLSEDEFEAVKRHAELGSEVAGKISFCREESLMIRHHHERFDGTGYPDGLKGGDIPLGARIIGLAEAFDTITTSRAYSPARTFSEALEEIQAVSGTQFDPKIVEAFSQVMKNRISKFS
ncbi:MAG: HD-GYP domain-containing protein [Vulcanimicrobiota bacterium]